jgi:hypothetical protein
MPALSALSGLWVGWGTMAGVMPDQLMARRFGTTRA